LSQLISQGPAEALGLTVNTQPAMLVAAYACYAAWRAAGGPEPAAVAGHSLGEYTALVCSGALDFRDAVDLVRFRGQVMQAAVPLGQGAMAAILGLEDGEVAAACAEAEQGEVAEPVNFNAPGQVVVAGNATAVARAIELARARGAKRAVLLPVSVPSHSRLMVGAAERLAGRLAEVDIRMPDVAAVYTVDVRTHQSPDGIRQALKEQLYKPVRWADTVRAMLATGVDTIVECGPGKVLTALNRRVERRPDLAMLSVEDPDGLAAALAACQEKYDA
jgi:[acyl-carrier-protein] S-malonyltransferase